MSVGHPVCVVIVSGHTRYPDDINVGSTYIPVSVSWRELRKSNQQALKLCY